MFLVTLKICLGQDYILGVHLFRFDSVAAILKSSDVVQMLSLKYN